MADDTASLPGQLGVGSADVFGFSNGGNVTMQLAIRHPETVRRLVVASSSYRSEGLIPELRESFGKPATPADIPAGLREEYLKIAPNPGDLQTMMDKSMQMMGSFRDWPADDLRGISAPTLLLIGDQDIVRPEHVIDMMRLIPGARLMVLPGGHGQFIGEASSPPVPSAISQLVVAAVEEFLVG